MFSAAIADPGSDDLTLTWDFGDGTAAVQESLNDPAGPDPHPSPDVHPRLVLAIAAHAYASPGTYVVALTAADDDGGTATTTASVAIP